MRREREVLAWVERGEKRSAPTGFPRSSARRDRDVSKVRAPVRFTRNVKPLLASVALAALLMAGAGCGSGGGAPPGTPEGFVGLSEKEARIEAASVLRKKYPRTDAVLAYVSQGFDPVSRRNAWDMTFYDHPGGEFTGCRVYVWDGGGRVDHCSAAARPVSGS